MNARPITWPTVPKGKDRVRVCLHAGNTEEEVTKLAKEMVVWALGVLIDAKGKSTVHAGGIVMRAQLSSKL